MVDGEADDTAVLESVLTLCGIVHVVSAASRAASDKHEVVTIVDVGDDTVTLVEAIADFLESGLLPAGVRALDKAARLVPDNVATAGIATIASQPLVQSAWIAAVATASDEHSGGGHGTTGRANGVGGACSKLITSPAAVALVPLGIVDRGSGIVCSRSSYSSSQRSRKCSYRWW